MPRKKTLNEFIKDARSIHGNKYDYSKTDYKNTATPITIICKKHGEFLQRPNDHLKGQNCPNCSGKYGGNTEWFIERAKEKHCDRYDYSNRCCCIFIISF
jgi:hypothetical protein